MIPFGEALHEQLLLTAGRGLRVNSACVAILSPHTILMFVSAYTIAIKGSHFSFFFAILFHLLATTQPHLLVS